MKHSHRETFLAAIVVQYGHDASERYEAHLSTTPLGETCVLLRRPFADEEPMRLPRPAGGEIDPLVHTVQSLVRCFFGDSHAAPRIVGEPDWHSVSLEVSSLAGARTQRLLFVELTCSSPRHATCVRADGPVSVDGESVTLCPEDADPVYAVTRLALSPRAVAAARRARSAQPLPVPPLPARRPAVVAAVA
jgi:hypothetical protein